MKEAYASFLLGGHMNIYDENGYVDIEVILSINIPFIFIIGGRSTGKTYGALWHAIKECIKFILMRRTQTQTDIINNPDFSPFKPINRDKGTNITTCKIEKNIGGIYDDIESGGAPIGYTTALSTIKNVRGFDASDVDLIIYDEFIPEKHERGIKAEADALWNAIETMNRNRELIGLPPIQLLALANSNDLANPLFLDLGVIRVIKKMQKKGQNAYINRERGLAIFDLGDSEISVKKAETALYKLKKGSDFAKMSLSNQYANEIAGRIKSRSLKEFLPIVMIGELCIYEHKHDDILYATTHKLGNPDTYTLGDVDKARFIRTYMWVWEYFINNKIEFEEHLCEILLKKVFM
jgi:hypothetical protein